MQKTHLPKAENTAPNPLEGLNYEYREPTWLILQVLRGADAQGIADERQESLDEVGILNVVMPPVDYYYGLKRFGDTQAGGKEVVNVAMIQAVTYEFTEFMSQLCKGNPHLLCALWAKSEHYSHLNAAGHLLIQNKLLFNTQKVAHSLMGCAKENIKAYEATNKIDALQLGYYGEERKAQIERLGYDTRFATEAIMYLRMCLEYIKDNTLRIYREDAPELKDIKAGNWAKHDIDLLLNTLVAECSKSIPGLRRPAEPDMEQVNKLCIASMQFFVAGGHEKDQALLAMQPHSTIAN